MRTLLLAAIAILAVAASVFVIQFAPSGARTPAAAAPAVAHVAAPAVQNQTVTDAAVNANAAPAAAAPAAAAQGADAVKAAQISVWCSVDDSTSHDALQGLVYVPDGSHGTMTLRLVGAAEGKEKAAWQATGQTTQIDIVPGQNSYAFRFDLDSATKRFADYRVGGEANTFSRIVGRDECGFRVPEAPSSALLLVAGGIPAALWIGMRRFGIRIPVLSRH